MSILASLRARRSLGELVIELDASRAHVRTLEEIAAALTGCVGALVLDLEDIGASSLQLALTDLAARLRAHEAPAPLSDAAIACQRDTLAFARRERAYLDQRDAELRRIIEVLTVGLAAIGEGSAGYHRRLLDNGTRLEQASRLGDLARMRAVISTEVTGLRKAVAERQTEERNATAALRGEVDRLRQNVEAARTEARVDPLTGAANRGAFDAELARRCAIAATGGEGFALLLADVDHFKAINDTHGHPVGDRVLRSLVTFLRERVRRDDLVARWGGEEFAIILPGAVRRVALKKARGMVADLADRGWDVDGTSLLHFTISIGLVAWQDGDDPTSLIERVDEAVYRAKHEGRNRVCVAGALKRRRQAEAA